MLLHGGLSPFLPAGFIASSSWLMRIVKSVVRKAVSQSAVKKFIRLNRSFLGLKAGRLIPGQSARGHDGGKSKKPPGAESGGRVKEQ